MSAHKGCACEGCTQWRQFLVRNRKGPFASMKAFGATTTTK